MCTSVNSWLMQCLCSMLVHERTLIDRLYYIVHHQRHLYPVCQCDAVFTLLCIFIHSIMENFIGKAGLAALSAAGEQSGTTI